MELRKNLLLIVILTAFSVPTLAQQKNKVTQYIDASIGVSSYKGTFTFSYLRNKRVGAKRRLSIGLGGRFTSFIGANQYYITAPSKFTSESTSPLILFKNNIVNNIDSVLVKTPRVNALNICINFDYRISSKVVIGFNIDAIGLSFGPDTKGNYINGVQGKNTEMTATILNVLLVSDNDRGTLNSEFYGRYFFNERWGVKTGLQFLFTEYTTKTKVQQFPAENDRFRNKAFLFSSGITYQL